MKIQEIAKSRLDLLSKTFERLNSQNLIKGKDIRTFTIMCLNAQEDGRLIVSKSLRYEFEEMLGMTTQSMTNSIARLKENDFVEGERGIYILKPEVLWNGTKKSRLEFFKESSIFEIEIKMK